MNARRLPLASILTALACIGIATGCAGTRAAYDAAMDPAVTPDEPVLVDLAKVTSEHWIATLAQANDLIEAGAPDSFRERAQAIERRATPKVLALRDASEAYKSVRSADNAEALQAALNEAAPLVSELVTFLQEY